MAVVFLLLSLFVSTGYTDDCAGRPDGNIKIGCRSFTVCINGVAHIHDCVPNTVYNEATGLCDDPRNVPGTCGDIKDCTGMPNHRYADVSNHCKSYYTCQDQNYYGHNVCTTGLVFDENLQTCNWPQNVLPPCGTLHLSTHG